MREEKEVENWWDNPTVEAIVDITLLGLIRAHRLDGGESEGTRLRMAKKALFGIPPRRGKPVENDVPELLMIAEMFLADRPDWRHDETWAVVWDESKAVEARSKSELARKALEARKKSEPDFVAHNEEEKVRNLEQKFERQKDQLLRLVAGWSDPGLALTLQRQHLAETLALLRIPYADVTDPNRDAKSVI